MRRLFGDCADIGDTWIELMGERILPMSLLTYPRSNPRRPSLSMLHIPCFAHSMMPERSSPLRVSLLIIEEAQNTHWFKEKRKVEQRH